MWDVIGTSIAMCENDYGVQLPIVIEGTTLSASDEVRFTLKQNGETLITKTFSNIVKNTVNLELTEAESELLQVGTYSYVLDWYQDGVFMCNIVPAGVFRVGDKA